MALALALAAAAAPAARADNLDDRLLKATPGIVRQLEGEHKNVGVLHFRVEKGKNVGAKAAFSIGTIAESLAERVENALVLCDKDTLNVIHDASATAAAAKVGAWYRSPGERPKLFKPHYPLAWGTQKVEADAFLTGVVKVPDGLDKVTVAIELLAKGSPGQLKQIAEFEVPTDRSLLRDLGQTFSVAKRDVNIPAEAKKDPAKARAAIAHARNVSAVANARKRDLEPPDAATTSLDVFGLEFQVRYDGQAQAIRGDPASSGEMQVNPVNAGQRVELVIVPRADLTERRAVVIRVNGKSTFQMEEAEGTQCQKWLIDPDPERKPTIYRGFYSDATDKNVSPFKVLTEEESSARAAEFGGKVGLIEVEVFGTGKKPEEADPLTISMRGVSKRSLETHKPKDRGDLQARILRGAGLKKLPPLDSIQKRGIITGDGEAPALFEPIVREDFPNPYSLGSKAIRYYTPTPAMTISP
jgi:hypothetical protein